MRFRNIWSTALGITLVSGACASAGGGGAAGGPRDTEFTNSAKLFIAQAEGVSGEQAAPLYQQALDASLQGIEQRPENAQHYYLAGVSYAGMGDIEGADTMFTRATEMFPDYAEDVEIAREQAWARLFNDGVNAYNAGNVDEAVSLWESANQIYGGRAEAYFNLAAVYTQNQDYDAAIDAYEQAIAALETEPGRELTPEEIADREESTETAYENLGQLLLTSEQFAEAEQIYQRYLERNPDNVSAQSSLAVALAKQGKQAEAMQTYEALLTSPDLSGADLFNIGVGLFQVEEFERAAEAFRRATEMSPQNRDAWYNYANALYAQEKWEETIPVGERLLELDPLNENAALILARAYREMEQRDEALRVLEANEAAPVFVSNLQLRANEGQSTVRGTIEPKSAAAGTPVQLRFTFYGPTGELGTETVTVQAPAEGATSDFEVTLQSPTPATGYTYEVAG